MSSWLPDVCIGVMADIQYKNAEPKVLERSGWLRDYRAALPKTSEAVSAFASRKVPFVLHLGDIIDGRDLPDERKALGSDPERAQTIPAVLSELDEILAALKGLPRGVQVLHTLGNHCLYPGRKVVEDRLGLTGSPYYAKDVSAEWRLIVLDSVDMSLFREEGHPLRTEADAFLAEHPDDPNSGGYNGGLGTEQRKWLVEQLKKARRDKMRVVVCSHHPIADESSERPLMWGHQWMQETLKLFNDVVVCYFAGHCHRGGYVELDGIHHITFQSVIDSDETNSYAFVTLSAESVDVEGVGKRGPPTRSFSLESR